MSDISFRDIGRRIDALYPVDSLRQLAGRFRYPGVPPGQTPVTLPSLRHCAQRALQPSSRVEFVHYNTWLLAATLDLKTILKATAGTTRLVQCLGLGYADILAKLLATVSSDSVCDALFPPVASMCGVSVNPANDTCKTVGSLANLAAAVIEEVGSDLDAVLDLFEIPVDTAIDIILEAAGLNVSLTLAEKPDRDVRAHEIGQEVFHYDLVSLCEVWDAARRSKVLAGGPKVTAFSGPPEPAPGEWQALGSGLLVFSTKGGLTGPATHTYQKAGVTRSMPGGCDFGALVDSDLWAKKGVQLTTLDVGVGAIDLYSTHLYSGGDLVDVPLLGLKAPTSSEKAAVRAAQVDELAAFIAKTHDPRHVAIVAGDFNIAAEGGEYAAFVDRLQHVTSSFPGLEGRLIQLDDWWALAAFGSAPAGVDTHGHTNRHGDGGGTIVKTFDSICSKFPTATAHPASPNQDDFYCDDRVAQAANATGDRIDFIFVERQTDLHAFILDVSRIRRRAFKRAGAHAVPVPGGIVQPQLFLSDHLGLEVTLFVNPRHQPA